MSLKYKDNQHFRSFDVIQIISLLTMCAAFYLMPLGHYFINDTQVANQKKAEVLSYQLAQIYQDILKNSEEENSLGTDNLEKNIKTVSSSKETTVKKEGFIGADNLGKPFRFQIIDSHEAKSFKVIVFNTEKKGRNIASTGDFTQNYYEFDIPKK